MIKFDYRTIITLFCLGILCSSAFAGQKINEKEKDALSDQTATLVLPIQFYRTHISKHSMFNTPPVINVYACLQTLKWIKDLGGLVEVEKRNIQKAKLIYEEIDRNKLFVGTAAVEDRSRMNATFVMTEEYKDLESDFLQLAVSKDIVGIKGHRSVGGFRASLYNALPIESVEVLVNCMKEFEAKH